MDHFFSTLQKYLVLQQFNIKYVTTNQNEKQNLILISFKDKKMTKESAKIVDDIVNTKLFLLFKSGPKFHVSIT